ncbi:acyl-CoA dehydrogenase domain-containing protein [Cupriavidus basilensis OR16]|uniref:Acyl-CoA dehydrogenase domain-containing protein n=1 Tax=Cupriavidus basilensis OR16 TaxID=1127483 RepID=H1S8H9_9BURK|nr:acyl-CoA dehydrogenase family protein [Cupriavidus basilensis]EHP41193.1 acyl-CoA dehydrogenase domain-containing protein [Cupriavidus basilensis OR16]
MSLDAESFSLLRASVQRFIDERLKPAEDTLEETDDVPAEIVADMKEMGLFGISIPENYGGIGLSMAQECDVVYDLGHTAFAFRSVFGTNVGIGSQGILMDGTEAQKQEYLPKIASGELVISFALTEPNAGSDAASLQTKAELDGDHYVINGTKRFITNAPRAGAFTLMARTGGAGASGISSFIVPANTPGISLGKPDKKMGQRGTKTCDVVLENVRVPAANIIGGVPGVGFKTAMKVLDRGRLHISALACGMAHRLITDAVAYAKERKQFGQPIGDFQLIQAMLADSQAELYAGLSMVRDCAQRYDAKTPGKSDPEVSMLASCTKMFCTEMVGRVADRAVQIHGGAGYIAEYKAERFYRDVRLLRLYEGTTQIQQLIIAKQLLRD